MIIYKKCGKTADKIVATAEAIVKAPGFDGCFVQHALGTTAKPHLVSVNRLGNSVCNECPLYISLKICPHALAGVDFLGLLPNILQNLLKAKISASAVSDLVFCNVKGGKKGNKTTPWRSHSTSSRAAIIYGTKSELGFLFRKKCC